MSQANLLLRFLLELAAIVAIGYWGFQSASSPLRFVLALGLPLVLIVVWAMLIAPKARSPLSPDMRVVLGSLLLLATATALFAAGQATLAVLFAGLIAVNTVLMFAVREP